MTATQPGYTEALTRMVADWTAVTSAPDPVPRWQIEMDRMAAEHSRLRAEGRWRSGGRTLLRALGVHHNEVIMCRGLAWLLTPDGWHGLGSTVLDGLLDRLGVDRAGSEHAVVVTEEARGDTRADIVVRFDGKAVLIEAKVWAFEQNTQADRLADGWAEDDPVLVFLTRDGKNPGTAITSRGRWQPLAWVDLGVIIAAAIAKNPKCEPGVREYLHTVEIYGGTRS